MASFNSSTVISDGYDDAMSIEPMFGAHMWPGPNTKGLNWHIRIPDANLGRRENFHKICFRHGQVKGQYILIVDGIPQIIDGYQPVTARQPTRVEFKMEGKNCCIIFDGMTSPLSYEHQLFIEGNRVPEARESVNIGLNEKMPTDIKSTETKLSAGVAYYGFNVVFADGSKHTFYRRYSQFGMLDALLRAQLDYHMVSSLPPLPGKVFNPYFNQLSPAFLAERQMALSSYLRQLLGNSKACHYSDLFCFLGLDPISGIPKSRGNNAAVESSTGDL